ncbi:hypothetical protein SMD44_08644 [Streptomyces alboflavus]|uniref:Ldh family oxidoreductase n=1 Tax=Streptomyces alboflavus TaxID=67267 RepID=A0A1Z1WRX8_9ACTN|nr:Ldh family oxidoreductase [Streptomyces alboflavus]ARX89157.1 hypothetical protein SMD44_08644 [Streptomyces alboflavus]
MSLPEKEKHDTPGPASGARAQGASAYLVDADAARAPSRCVPSARTAWTRRPARSSPTLSWTRRRAGSALTGFGCCPAIWTTSRGGSPIRRHGSPSSESGPSALLDADAALGVVAGTAGAREAVRRAERFGVGVVVVRNSNHFAAASIHSRVMSRAGMAGWAMTSASSRVAPFHGRDPLLGTNPVSVAAGAGDHEFVLDMATSQVCLGTVRERGRRGRPLDPGWATDGRGHATLDPDRAAALSPLGPGHKGRASAWSWP